VNARDLPGRVHSPFKFTQRKRCGPHIPHMPRILWLWEIH